MYSVERFEKEICISEYMDKYVNVEEFLEYCNVQTTAGYGHALHMTLILWRYGENMKPCM